MDKYKNETIGSMSFEILKDNREELFPKKRKNDDNLELIIE
jgi:hypothetical protein